MEISTIDTCVSNYLGRFGICKKVDIELKYTDTYYADREFKKYVFYSMVFNTRKDMIQRWETMQDEDIAIHLQSKVFPHKDIRWDMYFLLIYNGEEEIAEDELVTIERNKFCCKKIFVDGRTVESLENGLKAKLPFAKEYYPMKETLLLTEQDFLSKLRRIAGLDDKFTDDILINASKEPEKFGELLKKAEVNLVDKL